MAFRVLPAAEAFWRPSNQMGVLNTDLAKQLGAATLGARLWRLAPGQASTRRRHTREDEWYVRLLGGPPAFNPHATEAVWELAEHRFLFIVEDAANAGGAIPTMFVDDL